MPEVAVSVNKVQPLGFALKIQIQPYLKIKEALEKR